ncbi:MAG TPA: tetratricopeptide repeat protein [Terriglobia bacterium]|nr:tetratricopeptide repeat protein [Terriglobia bacterium]
MKSTTIFLASLLLPVALFSSPPMPVKPLTQTQITGLVKGGVPSLRLARLVEKRGINFLPTDDYLASLRKSGAEESLLNALRAARSPQPHPAPAPAEIAAKDLAMAAQLAAKRQWAQAENLCRQALKAEPRNASALFALAQTLNEEGKSDAAIATYRQELQIQPANAEPHAALAKLLERKNDVNASIVEYREAVRLNSRDTESYYHLGQLLEQKGDLKCMVGAERALVRLRPGDADAHQRLGLALYLSGELDLAVTELRKSLEIKPNDAETLDDLGDALAQSGDREGALQAYYRAHRLVPDQSSVATEYQTLLDNLKTQKNSKEGPK